MIRTILASSLVLVLAACGGQEPPPPAPEPEPEPTLDELSIEEAANSGFFEIERVDEAAVLADAASRDPDVILWFVERKAIATNRQKEKSLEELREMVNPEHVIVIQGTNYGEHPRHIERAGERAALAKELFESEFNNYVVVAPYDPAIPGRRALYWLVDRANVVYSDTVSADELEAEVPADDLTSDVEEMAEDAAAESP